MLSHKQRCYRNSCHSPHLQLLELDFRARGLDNYLKSPTPAAQGPIRIYLIAIKVVLEAMRAQQGSHLYKTVDLNLDWI